MAWGMFWGVSGVLLAKLLVWKLAFFAHETGRQNRNCESWTSATGHPSHPKSFFMGQLLQDPIKYAKYPCRDGRTLYWPDGRVANLELSEDQTVRIRSCGFPTAHPEINRGAVGSVGMDAAMGSVQKLRS